jgi:hypothetical protein
VRYSGIEKTGIWWMALDDFTSIFQDFNGDLDIQSGYVLYKRQRLHLIVLDRTKGQSDHDGLVGRHYKDIKMDNRRRTLLMGTHGDNEMDKKQSGLPMGVYSTPSGKYRANIDFYLNLTEHFSVNLSTYSNVETAAKAFQSVHKQKAKIIAELEKMDPNNRKARIQHAQSYISL